MKRQAYITQESWPLHKPFIIARGSRTEAQVVRLTLQEGHNIGHGEATPSLRYGETPASVIKQIESILPALTQGLNRKHLQDMLPAGAARNAVDSALWDLAAKTTGNDVQTLSGLAWPKNIMTVQTISILPPDEMAQEAKKLCSFSTIKVKLNADMIIDRVRAVHENAPETQLLVDANESWSMDILRKVAPQLAQLGVVMIEQPLPAGQDQELENYYCPLPIGADESCHTREDLHYLKSKYDIINIKLDKSGGLTEAIALMNEARALGLEIMVGCMLGSSLGMAPGMFLATQAKYVDLDAPALLAKDRLHGLIIKDGKMSSLEPELWGGCY